MQDKLLFQEMQKVLQQQKINNPNAILHSIVDQSLIITLNRPKKINSFNFAMYKQLTSLFNQAKNNALIKSVFLKANGQNFSGGNDLNNFQRMISYDDKKREVKLYKQKVAKFMCDVLYQFTVSIVNFDKPLLALVHGRVTGFTFTMLAHFDMVFATQDTICWAHFIRILQTPQFCSSVIFPQIFGRQKTWSIFALGERMNAKQLQKYGFLKVVKSKQQGQSLIKKRMKSLNQMDELTIRNTKRLMIGDWQMTIRKQIQSQLQQWKQPKLVEKVMQILMKPKL